MIFEKLQAIVKQYYELAGGADADDMSIAHIFKYMVSIMACEQDCKLEEK